MAGRYQELDGWGQWETSVQTSSLVSCGQQRQILRLTAGGINQKHWGEGAEPSCLFE